MQDADDLFSTGRSDRIGYAPQAARCVVTKATRRPGKPASSPPEGWPVSFGKKLRVAGKKLTGHH